MKQASNYVTDIKNAEKNSIIFTLPSQLCTMKMHKNKASIKILKKKKKMQHICGYGVYTCKI